MRNHFFELLVAVKWPKWACFLTIFRSNVIKVSSEKLMKIYFLFLFGGSKAACEFLQFSEIWGLSRKNWSCNKQICTSFASVTGAKKHLSPSRKIVDLSKSQSLCHPRLWWTLKNHVFFFWCISFVMGWIDEKPDIFEV